MLYLSRNNRFVGDACECCATGQYFEPERTIEQRHIVFRAWKSVQGRARGNYTCFRSGEFLYMRLCCVHNIFKECACGQHTRFFVFEMSQSAQNALSAVEPTQQFTATMSVPCLT